MKQHRKSIKMNIRRGGSEVKILRASEGTENGYGKKTDSEATWNHIDTKHAVPNHQSGETFRERNVSGGTRDISTPVFRFPYDADIESEDRFVFNGMEYEAKAVAPYRTHYVVQTVEVNG